MSRFTLAYWIWRVRFEWNLAARKRGRKYWKARA